MRFPHSRLAPLLPLLLLAACAREPARNPEVAADVKAFDVELANSRQYVREFGQRLPTAQDFRGRTAHDDIAQWVFGEGTLAKVAELRGRALDAAYPNDAKQILKQASDLANGDLARLKDIDAWWRGGLTVPFWRNYWNGAFTANGVAPEAPDSFLEGIERRMRTALDAGEFAAAVAVAPEMADALPESLSRAAGRILKTTTQPPQYTKRVTPCPAAAQPAASTSPARLVRGDAIDEFYPRAAAERGESGTVVLRARVDARGCAQSVAVVVHSGVQSLDDAALRWSDSARFSPAAEGGTPVESQVTWKVRFELRDGPAPGAAAR